MRAEGSSAERTRALAAEMDGEEASETDGAKKAISMPKRSVAAGSVQVRETAPSWFTAFMSEGFSGGTVSSGSEGVSGSGSGSVSELLSKSVSFSELFSALLFSDCVATVDSDF